MNVPHGFVWVSGVQVPIYMVPNPFSTETQSLQNIAQNLNQMPVNDLSALLMQDQNLNQNIQNATVHNPSREESKHHNISSLSSFQSDKEHSRPLSKKGKTKFSTYKRDPSSSKARAISIIGSSISSKNIENSPKSSRAISKHKPRTINQSRKSSKSSVSSFEVNVFIQINLNWAFVF